MRGRWRSTRLSDGDEERLGERHLTVSWIRLLRTASGANKRRWRWCWFNGIEGSGDRRAPKIAGNGAEGRARAPIKARSQPVFFR
jgi:hypothetical protein